MARMGVIGALAPDISDRIVDGGIDRLEGQADHVMSLEGILQIIASSNPIAIAGIDVMEVAQGRDPALIAALKGLKAEFEKDPAAAIGHVIVIAGEIYLLKKVGDRVMLIPKGPKVKAPVAPKSPKDILDALPGKSGKTGPIKHVPDAKALDDLHDALSKGGKTVDPGTYPGTAKALPDRTIIRRRPESKSGGAALDITLPDGTIYKVHIQK